MTAPVDMENALVRSIAVGVSVVVPGLRSGTYRILRRDRRGGLRDAGVDPEGRRNPSVDAMRVREWLVPTDDGTLAPTTAFLAAMEEHEDAKPPLYYALTPVGRPRPNQVGAIASAATVSCIATGRLLDGSGGPGYALSPDIVHALDMRRSGGGPKVILDAVDFDRMTDALRTARDALAGRSDAGPALSAVGDALAAVFPNGGQG